MIAGKYRVFGKGVAALCFGLFFNAAHPALAATDIIYVSGPTATAQENPQTCADGSGLYCARLVHGSSDTLFTPFGECYWLDNLAPTNDYFVPYKTLNEWHQFLSHLPDGTQADTCCPAVQAVVATLSDGTKVSASVPTGRTARQSSAATATKSYPMTTQACTTHWNGSQTCNSCAWSEVVTVNASCGGSGWNLQTTQSEKPACEPPAYIGPRNCPPSIVHGSVYWVTTGSSSSPGSAPTCHYEGDQQTQFRCWDGTATPTGQTQVINQTLVGDCTPPPPPTPELYIYTGAPGAGVFRFFSNSSFYYCNHFSWTTGCDMGGIYLGPPLRATFFNWVPGPGIPCDYNGSTCTPNGSGQQLPQY